MFLTIEIYTHTHSLSPKRKALDKLTWRKHQGKKKTSVPWFQPSFTMGMPVDPSWPNFFRQKVVRMVAGETPPSGTTSSITWENSNFSTSVEVLCSAPPKKCHLFDLSFIVICCPDFWRALEAWKKDIETPGAPCFLDTNATWSCLTAAPRSWSLGTPSDCLFLLLLLSQHLRASAALVVSSSEKARKSRTVMDLQAVVCMPLSYIYIWASISFLYFDSNRSRSVDIETIRNRFQYQSQRASFPWPPTISHGSHCSNVEGFDVNPL